MPATSRAPIEKPPLRRSLARMALRLAVILALAYLAHLMLNQAMTLIERLPADRQDLALTWLLVATTVVYALLIAVPFVPGVEIGISLLVLCGSDIAPYVWIGTISGLSLAFFAGRSLPYSVLHRFFLDLHLTSACRLLDEIEPLSQPRRLSLLRARLPGWLGTLAVRFRYVTIALVLNLPGTMVIGGGGGICLIAGMSGLFSRSAMVATLALATLPVPLSVWLFGPAMLSGP